MPFIGRPLAVYQWTAIARRVSKLVAKCINTIALPDQPPEAGRPRVFCLSDGEMDAGHLLKSCNIGFARMEFALMQSSSTAGIAA